MKFSIATAFAFGLAVDAHCIFQKLSVNDQDQGSLVGIRASRDNNPMQDVNSSDMICGRSPTTSDQVIQVKGGDKLGAYWGHVIGGEQFPNDPDHPIAASHKGPISYYLASVSDARSANAGGLDWFKVYEENYDVGSQVWAVDSMVQNGGWSYMTLPTCIAPGQYLLRAELLALHSAHKMGDAQFYISCAQIEVSSDGSWTPSSTVSIPGAYPQDDPSVFVNIYGLMGTPDNNGQAYNAPGPAAQSC